MVVCVVPGAVVASLLGLPWRSLRTWAVLPAFSFAVIFVIGEVAQLTGVPFGAPTVSVSVVVLAAIGFARSRRDHRAITASPPIDDCGASDERLLGSRHRLERQIALILLLLGLGIGIFTWLHGMAGHDLVPPQSDAAYHGFFVARILHVHSLDISKVVVSDPSGAHAVASYYPLGMHASAAVAAQLTGAEIGRVLVVITVLFAAIVLPLGMFVLARMLAPSSPLVAGFTALAVPSLALFPYGPTQFGDLPVVVGMALVPITIVLVADAILNDDDTIKRRVPMVISATLALLTVIAVHSSQLPVVIVLVGFLAVERAWQKRSPQVLGHALLAGIGITALAAVLFAPTLGSFGGGVSERSSFDNTTLSAVHAVIGPILSLDSRAFQDPMRQTLLALLACAGAVVWLLRRRFAWVLGYALVVGVMLLAAVSDSALSQALSLPWYRGPGRVGWNRGFFIPFFAGVALAFAVTGAVRLFKAGRSPLIAASLSAAVVFGVVIGYRGYQTSSAMLRYSFTNDARVTPDSEAAFAWLHRHAGRDDTIVNDVNRLGTTTDGGLWMYAQSGLRPLFGIGQPTMSAFAPPDAGTLPDLNDRYFLLSHLQELGRDPRTDQLARRYHARWVYFDQRVFTPLRHTLTLAGLETNPRLRLTFHRATVYVFEMSI